MQSSSDDSCVISSNAVNGDHVQRPPRRRLRKRPLVSLEGPVGIVCCIGHHKEDLDDARKFAMLHQPTFDIFLELMDNDFRFKLPESDDKAPYVHGFAVVQSYQFLTDPDNIATCNDHNIATCIDHRLEIALRSMLKKYYKRSKTLGFAKVPVLAAASLFPPLKLDMKIQRMGDGEFASYLYTEMDSLLLEEHVISGRYHTDQRHLQPMKVPLHSLIDTWKRDFNILDALAQLFRCPMDSAVAHLFSHGLLPFDMFAFQLRDLRPMSVIPGYPTHSQRVAFLRSLSVPKAVPDEGMQPTELHQFSRRAIPASSDVGPLSKGEYTVEHCIESLRASLLMKNCEHLHEQVDRTIRLIFPSKHEEMKTQIKEDGFEAPSRFSITRFRIRFDITCMLLRRSFNNEARPPGSMILRQLLFDASPVKGTELFAIREVVSFRGQQVLSRKRTLPLVTLAVGHYSGLDKAMALLHSIALECGFTYHAIRFFCDRVLICLPDSGTEHLLIDYPDLIPAFLAGTSDVDLEQVGGYLFRNAVWVPEANHIWDLILRQTLWGLEWFEKWFSLFSKVVNFLEDDGRVNILKSVLTACNISHDCIAKRAKAVHKLRWGTIYAASKILKKQERMLQDTAEAFVAALPKSKEASEFKEISSC